MKQVDQRGGECPIPADIQDQAGWGSEHLIKLSVSLFIGEEMDQMAFKGSSLLKRFYNSMTLCPALLEESELCLSVWFSTLKYRDGHVTKPSREYVISV